MIVQSTPQAFGSPQGDWRRVQISGTAPTLLRLSVWAIGDGTKSNNNPEDILLLIGKIIVAIPLQFIVLTWAFTRSRGMTSSYPAFPSRSWDYPKYARNSLDSSPLDATHVTWKGAVYEVAGDQGRLLGPRQLMIHQDGKWALAPGTPQPYIVISYTARQFKTDALGVVGVVEKLAEEMARQAGVSAYWLDYRCRASQQPQLTDDVHRICDVFRGARQVCVVLPELSDLCKQQWGQSMWTLPEVILVNWSRF